MQFIHAQYLAYRDSDGTLSSDKYIRAIMADGHDIMILAAPFYALTDFIAGGGEILPPEPVVPMQVNLQVAQTAMAAKAAAAPPVEETDV
jgi:hypothetical protein